MNPLLTPKEVASYIAKSDAWVRAHATALGGMRIGKEWRFHPTLLDDLTPPAPNAATLAVLCRSTNAAKASGPSGGAKAGGSANSADSRRAPKRKTGSTRASSRGFDAAFPEYAASTN